jgi:hypothetical protein
VFQFLLLLKQLLLSGKYLENDPLNREDKPVRFTFSFPVFPIGFYFPGAKKISERNRIRALRH